MMDENKSDNHELRKKEEPKTEQPSFAEICLSLWRKAHSDKGIT
jgi:hypothetical protein